MAATQCVPVPVLLGCLTILSTPFPVLVGRWHHLRVVSPIILLGWDSRVDREGTAAAISIFHEATARGPKGDKPWHYYRQRPHSQEELLSKHSTLP